MFFSVTAAGVACGGALITAYFAQKQCNKKRIKVVFPCTVNEIVPDIDSFRLGNVTFHCTRQPDLEIEVECPPEVSPWQVIKRLSRRIPAFRRIPFRLTR
jgi:hypothetical protein